MALKRKVSLNLGKNYVSIEAAFEEFIAEKENAGIAPKTIRNYIQSFEFFIDFEFEGDTSKDINEVLKIYVEQWKASMMQEGKRITTINHYIRDVRTFLYWCMHEDRLYIEPAYKIDTVKGQKTLPKIFTDEEVEILIATPTNVKDWVEWRDWAITNWVVGTGNRAETVCELKIGDIDFKNQQVVLRHTKTKDIQVIPLSHALENVMRTYLRKCRSGCSNNDWLFPNISNERLTYNALAHTFSKYCKSRGVEHTNIHGLRHYFGTSLARRNYSGEKIQKLLGHSTYTTTQNYISLVENDLKEDYATFNPLDTIKRGSTRRKTVTIK